ncbi:uncharacterized protein TNCV_2632871 [Trichonephila clavipes]|nr:uncharacterized protein TNCV_2632871 [Trichonephila clavipes]
MLSLNECPFTVLVCKFQPSLPVNSNQHRCMNQTSAVREQPEQRSLNSSLEDTVGNPLILLGATRELLATDHVILNHGQVMWMTPELAPPSPNYHTTPTGGRFSSQQI